MPESVDTLLLTIISILIIIIFGGSMYAFFHAIFLFIFSAGDNDKIKQAWNSIRFMILGILLTLFFLFIFPIIFQRLNLPNYEKFKADAIFRHTGELLSGLFSFGKDAVNQYNDSGGNIGNPYIGTSGGTGGGYAPGTTSGGGGGSLGGSETGGGLEL